MRFLRHAGLLAPRRRRLLGPQPGLVAAAGHGPARVGHRPRRGRPGRRPLHPLHPVLSRPETMSTVTDPGATAVWPPPPGPGEPARSAPPAREVVTRALPALALALLLGWLVEPWLGVLIVVAAGLLTTVALLSPTAARWIERVFGAIGQVVGRVLSAVVLTLVFVVVFVPVGLLARLFRRDPLSAGVGPSGHHLAGAVGLAGAPPPRPQLRQRAGPPRRAAGWAGGLGRGPGHPAGPGRRRHRHPAGRPAIGGCAPAGGRRRR